MTKLRLSLRNLVRAALNSLILINLLLFFGCSSSTKPTFLKEDIDKAIQDICKNEYKIDVKVRLVGETVWIYLPVENLFEKANKPEKYIDKFVIEKSGVEFIGSLLKVGYKIRPIPDEEKPQEFKYNKAVMEKVSNVWKVLRRVLFSMERPKKGEPKFFCLVTADIKNGFEMSELFYYLDLKKVSYGFISWNEYLHRAIQETDFLPEIIGDKEGLSIKYHDITMQDFIIRQIQHRIKLKFQKPEVDKTVDIDKEIKKIIIYVFKTYNFKDFSMVELNNLFTDTKIISNRLAIWESTAE